MMCKMHIAENFRQQRKESILHQIHIAHATWFLIIIAKNQLIGQTRSKLMQPARAKERQMGGELLAGREVAARREAAVLTRGQEAEAARRYAMQHPSGVNEGRGLRIDM